MLQNDFFTIVSQESGEGKLTGLLEFDPAHAIFKGHFPGVPAVPGVCMMQMVKEMLENAIGVETTLRKAMSMKFLALINPLVNRSVQFEINYTGELQVNASLYNEGVVYFKFKGGFTKLPSCEGGR